VAKVTAGITITHYLYGIQYRVLEERGNSEELLILYAYGAGIDEPLTPERGGQTYYYHRDALGGITEVSNSSGDIVERYDLWPGAALSDPFASSHGSCPSTGSLITAIKSTTWRDTTALLSVVYRSTVS
jgi:hypothetical protein